jgi:hypothetical protein
LTTDAQVFFTLIDDADDVRQGDLICKKLPGDAEKYEYGVIANADCDLANKKHGGNLTWLRIITLAEYYEQHWLPEKISKVLEKQLKGVLDAVNAQIRRLDKELGSLNADSLCSWLAEQGHDAVVSALASPDLPVSDDLNKKLYAVHLLLSKDGLQVGMSSLKKALAIFKVGLDTVQADMEKALSNSGGFPDCFVLPELPNTKNVGFVVMLRSMQVVSESEVYKTELDGRLADGANKFYRLGRLSDRVRFGLMQKLGFLFMRIGDHPTFDMACKATFGIVAEELIGGGND